MINSLSKFCTLFLLLQITILPTAFSAPLTIPNDDFENARIIDTEGETVSGISTGSTIQPGEPEHFTASNSNSVWFRWIAPRDGAAVLSTSGSDFDTVLAVYTGNTLAGLTPVASNNDANSSNFTDSSRIEFTVTEATEYFIALDSFGNSPPGIYILDVEAPAADVNSCNDLNIRITFPPHNDRVGVDRILVQGTASGNLVLSDALDIVFVVDTSGSLRGTDPDNFRNQALLNILNNVPDTVDYLFGLVDFDNIATLEAGLTNDFILLENEINQLDQSGGTNIQIGIDLAIEELNRNGRPNIPKTIVLFSDGGGFVDFDKVRNSPYPINTLYLGQPDSFGSDLLEQIADLTDGIFQEVTDPNDLIGIFSGALTASRVGRVEVFSTLDPGNVITIDRDDIILGIWEANNLLVDTRLGIQTQIIATVFPAGSSDDCTSQSRVTVIGGSIQGAPTTPGNTPVLCALPTPLSFDPDGGKVSYLFEWYGPGFSRPIVFGPSPQPFSFLYDGDRRVSLDPGERWLVDVKAIDDEGDISQTITGTYDVGGNSVQFNGWTVRDDTMMTSETAPGTPGTSLALAAVPRPYSYDPDGGNVQVTYTWSSDGNDQPIVIGPTFQTFSIIRDGENGVTLDVGETWTVQMQMTDDEGDVSDLSAGTYTIGEAGAISFSGWIVK